MLLRAHVLRNIWADFARFRLGVAWKLQDGHLVDIAMGISSKMQSRVDGTWKKTTPRHCVLVTLARRGGERNEGPYRKRYREPDLAFGTMAPMIR